MSLTVERTWIQGGAEVINGASVTAQSVVALLCRGILTAVIYLLSSATHTLKHHVQVLFLPRIRNAGVHPVQQDL